MLKEQTNSISKDEQGYQNPLEMADYKDEDITSVRKIFYNQKYNKK